MYESNLPDAWEIDELPDASEIDDIPDAWEIAELERMRHIHDSELGERPMIPLYPPIPEAPARGRRHPDPDRSVVIIDLA